jgi:hypothetical protein
VCDATAPYTNNTGWADFIITPTVGPLWLLGEDTVDRFISDPLVRRHPNSFGIKMVRASLNPPASLANILRGHYPWRRDYEHPNESESFVVGKFERALDEEPNEHWDLNPHYTSLGLGTYQTGCLDCRTTTTGAGVELGVAVRRYLDVVVDMGVQPHASPLSALNVGGSLFTGSFGVRSGYSGRMFAVKAKLAPGFASYSRSQPTPPTEADPNPSMRRNFNFSAVAALSGDIRFGTHFAFRTTVEQMLIRYKSSAVIRRGLERLRGCRFCRMITTSTRRTGGKRGPGSALLV